jgi:predicted nucleic acid-binding protein
LIVLDASAVLELLLNTRVGKKVAEHMGSPEISLHAPHLVDLEAAQILRRYVRLKTITKDRGQAALDDFLSFDLERYPHEPMLSRIWDLRNNLTAYDASYVALAEVLDAPLLTCDERLATASGHRARVVVIK